MTMSATATADKTQAMELQREMFSIPTVIDNGIMVQDPIDTEEARQTIQELVRLQKYEPARMLFFTTVSALNDWSDGTAKWLLEMTMLVQVYCEMEQKANNNEAVQRASYRLLDLCRNPITAIDDSPEAPRLAEHMEKIAEILTKNRQYLVATALLNRVLHMRFSIAKRDDSLSNMNQTAVVMEKLAISTHMQGHLYEAEKIFRLTLAVRERACERDPSVVQNWYKAGTMELMGDLFSVMALPEKAYLYFGQCINILEEALAEAAKPERVLRHITSIKNKLGDVALNNSDFRQARIFYEESLRFRQESLEKLQQEGRGDTENAYRDVVFSLLRLSDLDFREAKYADSEAKLDRAVASLDKAVNELGERVKILESYYVPLDRLIRLHAQKGSASTHAGLIDRMNKLLRKLVAMAPDNPTYRKWFEDF